MKGIVLFIIAVCVFTAFFVVAVVKSGMRRKRASLLKPVNYLMIGTFVASFFMFIPVYIDFFNVVNVDFRTLAISVHNAIRLFLVDADFEIILNFASQLDGVYSKLYQIVFAVLYVTAPVLTFSFVVSLFKNASAQIKLIFCSNKDLYVFSDLNDRSLSLATDIVNKKPRSVIVFADVSVSKDESNDHIEKALELGAILFQKSISSINYKLHSKNKELVFFAIGDNEEENVSKSSELFERHKDVKNSHLYIFSMTKQSELFLDSLPPCHTMKLRRIDESACLINRYFFDNGKGILDSAYAVEDGKKVISTVVVGMGRYGTEMAKTLPWFCQLPGYKFKLNIIDKDQNVESRFKAICPEFLNPECNRVYVEGEAQYDISVHGGVDYELTEYGELLKSIPDASFVFICLGSDEENVACAVRTRMYFERMGVKPKIVTVVFDSDKIERIKNAKSKDLKAFDIEYTGSLRELYSANVIINTELENRAIEVHNQYRPQGVSKEEHEESFWTNEYNYNSSCASAIHNKVRVECGISGADKKKEDMTEEEIEIISVTEHRRWNAYVRSCGYIYSGSTEKDSRSDLALKHNCLIPFSELSEEYKKIDTIVAIMDEKK